MQVSGVQGGAELSENAALAGEKMFGQYRILAKTVENLYFKIEVSVKMR